VKLIDEKLSRLIAVGIYRKEEITKAKK